MLVRPRGDLQDGDIGSVIAAGDFGFGFASGGEEDGDFIESADGVFGGNGESVAPEGAADAFAAAVEDGDDRRAGALHRIGELV